MDVRQILDAIHVKYEQATDSPTLQDDDGAIRLSLLQESVRRWAKDDTTRWLELFELYELGPVEVGTRDYLIGADFNLGDAVFLEGEDKPLDVKAVHQLTGKGGRFVTILGNKRAGYKVRLGWSPASDSQEIGKKIVVRAYREPFIPTELDHVLEMSDPQFAINYVTAELFVNDDTNMFAKFNNDALRDLANMRQRNDNVLLAQHNGLEDNYGGNMGIGGE